VDIPYMSMKISGGSPLKGMGGERKGEGPTGIFRPGAWSS